MKGEGIPVSFGIVPDSRCRCCRRFLKGKVAVEEDVAVGDELDPAVGVAAMFWVVVVSVVVFVSTRVAAGAPTALLCLDNVPVLLDDDLNLFFAAEMDDIMTVVVVVVVAVG